MKVAAGAPSSASKGCMASLQFLFTVRATMGVSGEINSQKRAAFGLRVAAADDAPCQTREARPEICDRTFWVEEVGKRTKYEERSKIIALLCTTRLLCA